MNGHRAAGILWFVGGASALGILPFVLNNLLHAAVFLAGTVVAIALAYLLAFRPSAAVVTWSTVAGIAWVVAFGAIVVANLGQPIAEVVSVVWVAAFGAAGGLVAYFRA